MDDFLISDVATSYYASKNRAYRSRVLALFRAFVVFLQSHGLTVRELLGPDEIPAATAKIMKSDLTDEGYALVVAAYDRWLKANDSDKEIDNAVLEAALDRLRHADQ